jgi:hypothetical protein
MVSKSYIKIYKNTSKPIMMFGCEAWSTTEDKKRLNIWERKIMKKKSLFAYNRTRGTEN